MFAHIKRYISSVTLAAIVVTSWAAMSHADEITIVNQYNKVVFFSVAGTVTGEFTRKGWFRIEPGSVYFFNTTAYSDSTIYLRFQVAGSANDLIFSARPTGSYYVHSNAFEVKNVGPGTYYASPPNRVLLSSQMAGYGYSSKRHHGFSRNHRIFLGRDIPIASQDFAYSLERSWREGSGRKSQSFYTPNATRIVAHHNFPASVNHGWVWFSTEGNRIDAQASLFPGNIFDQYGAWARGTVRVYYRNN